MNNDELKKLVAKEAVTQINDGMTIGLGTGSTMQYVLEYLGDQVKKGLNISGIPTSENTAKLAKQLDIPLTSFKEVRKLDLAIDGADEVDANFNLIKGGGGALLREKIIADSAKSFVVVIDKTKLVEQLGAFLLPVEIIPFGWEVTAQKIESLGGVSTLRELHNQPYITDNENYILDCDFGFIDDPKSLEKALNSIVGIVDSGLFINMTDKVLIGDEHSVKTLNNTI
ncbi:MULTISPECIES: ribose-5-phosphate isomerase RpiA [Staphylococcus]|uniref:ribose-5-phosphate isomerase RpiA n=1 Tax=Staphylococcus TaxID=1279 RepID=UPI000D1E7577|nr:MULTISPECIES: ribose-5-phosphate isomerase RpiA [Staphylococcus]PTK47041.1 ribose 5-phosphate isomerase A [Staphylococcus saprophyticus]RIM73938.1 ribose-5-phosphate isomerase RpiA [Staphylococcus arlettae]RIN41874.1 ribose-5-phosphate isomerase RpiA [Staphylococcus succinus]